MFDFSSKKNEGRASSHLELVERADPVPLLGAPEPAAPAPPKKGFKLGWKMKTFIGTAAVINGLYAWVLVKNYQAKKAAGNHRNSTTPLNSATPPSNDTSYIRNQPPPGYQPNDVSHLSHRTQQTTDPPNANQQNYQEPSTNAYQQNYEGSSTNANQQTYEEQSTSPPQTSTSQSNRPWTNNGPNFRREERPRGRRSPVDILSELHPKSRLFSVANIILLLGLKSQVLIG